MSILELTLRFSETSVRRSGTGRTWPHVWAAGSPEGTVLTPGQVWSCSMAWTSALLNYGCCFSCLKGKHDKCWILVDPNNWKKNHNIPEINRWQLSKQNLNVARNLEGRAGCCGQTSPWSCHAQAELGALPGDVSLDLRRVACARPYLVCSQEIWLSLPQKPLQSTCCMKYAFILDMSHVFLLFPHMELRLMFHTLWTNSSCHGYHSLEFPVFWVIKFRTLILLYLFIFLTPDFLGLLSPHESKAGHLAGSLYLLGYCILLTGLEEHTGRCFATCSSR